MRNAILLSLIGVIVLSLVTIGTAYALPQDALGPASSVATPSAADRPEYLLRAYHGKLAVFTTDLSQPDMVFDVYLRTLPTQDIQALEKGILVDNYEQLTALIEDYIS